MKKQQNDIDHVDKNKERTPEKYFKRKTAQGAALMQAEERNTGAVPWKVYKTYISAAKGAIMLPHLLFSIALLQVASVMSAYW